VSIKHARLVAALAVLSLGRGTWGQVSEADSVKGEVIVSPPGAIRSELTLSDPHGQKVATATAATDGSFEFRHVPYGQYRLTVSDNADRPIHDEWIVVHQQQAPIEIHVEAPEQPKPPVGAVSARELLHPPAKKAVKAFQAAQRSADGGDHETAALQLEQSVALSPDFAAAWVALGTQHIYLKRYEQALGELMRARELAGPSPIILCNQGYAQFALHRYAEGTKSLREALRLYPTSAPAHYLLGTFLERDPRTLDEAVTHLEIAARSMPAARAELDRARRESAKATTHP